MERRNVSARALVATSSVSGWALVVIWALVILVLSLQPGTEELGRGRFRLDLSSAGHAAFFAILAFLVASVTARYSLRRASWWTLVLVALFGIASELLQSAVPLRTPSLSDLVADVIGGTVGCGVFVVGDRWAGGAPLHIAVRALVPGAPRPDADSNWRLTVTGGR